MTWKLPEDEEPPAGKRLLILGWGGGVTLGPWCPEYPDVAWTEIPVVPDELKQRITRKWTPDHE
jgi:hypothetical protein